MQYEQELLKKDKTEKDVVDLKNRMLKVQRQQMIKKELEHLQQERQERELDSILRVNKAEYAINKKVMKELGIQSVEEQDDVLSRSAFTAGTFY